MAAIYCGLWPALLAAITSTLAYNFFFTVPYHTFMIDRPADVVTVVVLLLVVLVVSASALRAQSQPNHANAALSINGAGELLAGSVGTAAPRKTRCVQKAR